MKTRWGVAAIALAALFLVLVPLQLSRAPGAVQPSGSIKWCDDTGDDLDRLITLRKRQAGQPFKRAVIVLGLEASGSKLIAQTVSRMLHHDQSRDLLAPESEPTSNGQTLEEYWSSIAWAGHGNLAAWGQGWVVVHRSFPHGASPCFPRVRLRASI